MKKKIYYGDFSLLYWINLLIKKKLELPEYQRHFVWEKDMVIHFLQSLHEGIYIPPVTIGSIEQNGVKKHIILDGQQRLSSILLGALGVFPKHNVFKKVDEQYNMDLDNEDIDPEAKKNSKENALEWTYNDLLGKDIKNLDALKGDKNISENYEKLPEDSVLNEEFLENTFLGYSFIVPESSDANEQQKFYSTTFRNINHQGVGLTGQESRRALYYLSNDLVPLFEPAFYDGIKVQQGGKPARFDFVRSLAFLSQYKKTGEINLAKGCYRQDKLEAYLGDYINAVVTDANNTLFAKFSSIIGKDKVTERMERLRYLIETMELYKIELPSIIHADLYHLGLIYIAVIEDKTIEPGNYTNLKRKIKHACDEYENDAGMKRAPNQIRYIKKRITKSIRIYLNYAIDAHNP